MQNEQKLQKTKDVIFRLCAFDPRITSHLFETESALELRDRPDKLLAGIWELQPEQRIVARAALDIWNASGHAYLAEILSLSAPTYSRFLKALAESHPKGKRQ